MTLETRLADLEKQVVVVQVLVGVNLALTLGVLWLNFSILGRLPQ